MTTAMELAFAKIRGVTVVSRAPEEHNGNDPRRISITIAGVRMSLASLMDGEPIPVGDIDPEMLEKSMSYVGFQKRAYVERGGILYFENPGKPPKPIERIGYESHAHASIRDIDREIVAILKGEKDLFTTEAGTVKHIRNLLLRLLADHKTRSFLQAEKSKSSKVVGKINDALNGKIDPTGLESEMKPYYESVTQSLGFSELDHMVVRALSWEWKSRPIFRSHPYACRCWVMILCLFGLTKS